MSLKRLLPLAGLVAMVGCAGATGPACWTTQPDVVGVDAEGAPIVIEARVQTEQCQELDEEF